MRKPKAPGHLSDEMLFRAWATGIIIVALTIVRLITIDLGGRSEREHPYKMPETVTALSWGYTFLIADGARTRPVDVCWGNGSSSAKRIEQTAHLAKQQATYVQCGEKQKFDPRVPSYVSKNFQQSIGSLLHNSAYWYMVAIIVALLLVPWVVIHYHVLNLRYERWLKRQREQAQHNIEEQRLKEIVRAFSRSEITAAEYDAGLERAYIAGVKKAE